MRETFYSSYQQRLERLLISTDHSPHQSSSPHWSHQSFSPPTARPSHDLEPAFNSLALELFAWQFEHVPIYQQFCRTRGVTPATLNHWNSIPSLPVSAFKQFDVTSLSPTSRTRVFHSSGTTQHTPSRHYHSAETLAVYEASLLPWFEQHLLTPLPGQSQPAGRFRFLSLTPSAHDAPHSSLAYMCNAIIERFGSPKSGFAGLNNPGTGWTLDLSHCLTAAEEAIASCEPLVVLGTAFSFVALADAFKARPGKIQLPPGSRAMETGGYKGRSRALSKPELYSLISETLEITPSQIISEYGMSELSSQAYDGAPGVPTGLRAFRFPPWARAQLINPETGRESSPGQPGLIRVLDLANVSSVLSIQTEDLASATPDGFMLLGRAQASEPRGCSIATSATNTIPQAIPS